MGRAEVAHQAPRGANSARPLAERALHLEARLGEVVLRKVAQPFGGGRRGRARQSRAHSRIPARRGSFAITSASRAARTVTPARTPHPPPPIAMASRATGVLEFAPRMSFEQVAMLLDESSQRLRAGAPGWSLPPRGPRELIEPSTRGAAAAGGQAPLHSASGQLDADTNGGKVAASGVVGGSPKRRPRVAGFPHAHPHVRSNTVLEPYGRLLAAALRDGRDGRRGGGAGAPPALVASHHNEPPG